MPKRNMEDTKIPSLSKESFLRGLQCLKSLYLDKTNPALRDKRDAEQQEVLNVGADVGLLAQGLFPGGVEIPFDGLTLIQQLDMTRDAIARGTDIVYEAAAEFDNVFIKADILRKTDQGWELYEVKATTQVKPHHLDDLAIQLYVLKGAGIPICKTNIVHLNNQYVRQGALNVQELFTISDVTTIVFSRQDQIPTLLEGMRACIKGKMPAIDIGEHCDAPYTCDFQGHCWQHVPDDSIFDLCGRGVNKYDLYRQGILELKDAPLGKLSPIQRIQVETFIKRSTLISKQGILSFLSTLWYPLCFIDFETIAFTVPEYNGTRPYQPIPFQFSVHTLTKEGSPVTHREYLANARFDPRQEFTMRFLEAIPADACVIAYNASFEKGRLQDCAAWFPEYRTQITNIIENVRDIMTPFQKKFAYHWLMQGSASLKKVLPAFIPELTYEVLDIRNGGMAMQAYDSLRSETDAAKIKELKRALLDYCRLDTLAMVRLFENLFELSK